MARLKGRGSNTGANLVVMISILIILFLLLYYFYLKPNGYLNLGF